MSGYRTLHRRAAAAALVAPPSPPVQSSSPEQDENDSRKPKRPEAAAAAEPYPLWSVKFSPCHHTPTAPRVPGGERPNGNPPLRLLTATGDDVVRAYSLIDKDASSDALDASALTMEPTHELIGPEGSSGRRATPTPIGMAALDVCRNYLGEDPRAGDEATVACRLDGTVRVWVRSANREGSAKTPSSDGPEAVAAFAEFRISEASGTTLVVRPPRNYPQKHRRREGLAVAVGCLDGSVKLCATGVALPLPPGETDRADPPEPGELVTSFGSGSALPTSLAYAPQGETLAVGRKDGSVDIYHSDVDEYDASYRKIHHLSRHVRPVRGLTYSLPDGSLLLSGCDSGTLYVHDVLRPRGELALVHAVQNAHASWIADVESHPDGRRFVTSGADGTVKVWDLGSIAQGPLHSFERAHKGMAWKVAVSVDGRRIASGGDDGALLIHSCEE